MIFAKERGRVYVEEQAHGSADDRREGMCFAFCQFAPCESKNNRRDLINSALQGTERELPGSAEVRWFGNERIFFQMVAAVSAGNVFGELTQYPMLPVEISRVFEITLIGGTRVRSDKRWLLTFSRRLGI
jgi:hypothetical protein